MTSTSDKDFSSTILSLFSQLNAFDQRYAKNIRDLVAPTREPLKADDLSSRLKELVQWIWSYRSELNQASFNGLAIRTLLIAHTNQALHSSFSLENMQRYENDAISTKTFGEHWATLLQTHYSFYDKYIVKVADILKTENQTDDVKMKHIQNLLL